MIGVGSSTMTITTLILLLATGILAVTLVHGQQTQNDRLINNCYQLGYGRFTFSRKTNPSGLYVVPNYCKDDHLEAA